MGVEKKMSCGLVLERDRGYAWVILAASYLPQMCSIGFAFSVAVLLHAWSAEFQHLHSAALISFTGSLNCACLFCSGVLASILIERFNHRFTVALGGLLCSLGYIISFFAPNIWVLLIGYGVFVGVGFGLIYMGSATIVSLWFDRYRAIACGISVSGNGIGTFVNAYLLKIFIDHSGWRGCMLYQACIVVQVCVVAMLFKPPPPQSPQRLNLSEVNAEETSCLQDTKDELLPKKKPRFSEVFLQLLRVPRFIAFFINNVTWPLGVIVFYSFCVRLALEVGEVPLGDAVWAVSCIGLIDAFLRIIVGALSSSFNISPSLFYAIGQLGLSISIMLSPFMNSFLSPLVASFFFGASFGCQLGVIVSTTAELFDSEQISTVFGILIVANGIGNGFGPIFANLLLETVDSNFTYVYFIFGLIVFSGLALNLPFFISHWMQIHSGKTKNSTHQPKSAAMAVIESDGYNEDL